jgi:hypothetical protein
VNRRDFIKLAGLLGISALLPKGLRMASFSELMMKVVDGQQLSPIEREQMRQYTNEMDTNNQLVSSWQQVNKKIRDIYLDLPIVTIYSETLTTSVPNITIQIPSDYKHLMMFCAMLTDRAAASDYIHGRFNGDTGTNYAEQYAGGVGSSSSDGSQTSRDDFGVTIAASASASANTCGSCIMFIPHYNSTIYKTVINNYGIFDGTATGKYSTFCQWKSTSPIRSLTLFSENSANIISGSVVTLLGIK